MLDPGFEKAYPELLAHPVIAGMATVSGAHPHVVCRLTSFQELSSELGT